MSSHNAMQFAVRPTVVGRLLADMYGILALLCLVPAAVALATGSPATGHYLLVIASFGGAWLVGRILPLPNRVQKNEALTMVALLFVTSALLMALPLRSYGLDFVDAFFEAVSGVTTTGLSTATLEDPPAAFLFGRAWMQWIGGVGVVVLALAILVRPGVVANRLGFSDSEMDNVVGGTRAHARRVIIIYLLLTGAGTALLLLSGASVLDAVVHSMAAVSTGGFANYADSLATVGTAHLLTVSLLCIAGAVSFHAYYRSLLRAGRKDFFENPLYTLLGLIALGAVLLWLLAGSDSGISARDAAATVISAQTTAGFSTVDLGLLPPAALLLLCVLMAIGGGVGSTAGGFKIDRAIVLLKVAHRALLRSTLSEQVYIASDRHSERNRLDEAVSLLVWFLAVVVLSWMAFVAYGYPALPSLFEVISALSTVGLSAGITSAALPDPLKLVLCVNMLLGRLEIIALLVLLAPRNWFGRRRRSGGLQ